MRLLLVPAAAAVTAVSGSPAAEAQAARAYAVGASPGAGQAVAPPTAMALAIAADTAGAAGRPTHADSVPRFAAARRRSHRGRNALIGAAVGFTAGAVVGYRDDHGNQRSYCRAHPGLPCSPEPLQLTSTLIAGGALGLLGGFVGALFR